MPQRDPGQQPLLRQRNRRSNFARTAKSTLVAFLKAGGRLASLKPAEVTKEALAAVYAPARAGPASLNTRLERTEDRLEGLVKELAEANMDAARELVANLQDRLIAIVKGDGSEPGVRQARRASDLILNQTRQ